MMVGRNVSFSVNKKPSKPGDTVLKVEHMTVPSKVHGNNAVKDVSFNVRKGEIVCIAGIDGNGQSEFVQGLTGLEKVSGGKILFNGQDITPTRGLDVGAIEYIHSQLVAQRDKGKAVLLVSLELDEVMDVSDRILVMYEGELVGQLDPKTVSVEELGLYMAGAKRDPVPEEV